MGARMLRKGLAVAVILLFIGMCVVPSTAVTELKEKPFPINFDGNTLYVGGSGSGNYTTIQSAINDAVDGDTVFVYDDSSPYIEHVSIGKQINLIGENKETTIINLSGPDGLTISSNNVTVSGFTIQNGICGIYFKSGLNDNVDDNIISDNIIKNNKYGIFSVYCNRNEISKNKITDNEYGLWITTTRNHIISNNSIENNGKGLYISGDAGHTILSNSFKNNGIELGNILSSQENIIINNTVNGKPLIYLQGESDVEIEGAGQVILVACDNIKLSNSELCNAGTGIRLMETNNCVISNNNISSNVWRNVYLYNSNNNVFSGNIISYSKYGLFIILSDYNSILNNQIEHNDYGIYTRETVGLEITGNKISSNSGYGLLLKSIRRGLISKNNISENNIGLYFQNRNPIFRNNRIIENVFLNNEVHADFEIHWPLFLHRSLKWSRNSWDDLIGGGSFHIKPISGLLIFFHWTDISGNVNILGIPWSNFDFFAEQIT